MRWSKRAWRILAAFVLLAVLGIWLLFPPNPGPVIARIKELFPNIEARIQQARDANGNYPQTLPAALAADMAVLHRRWTYHSEGDSFDVSFGEYSEDDFAMWWSSKDREWNTDS